MSDKDGCSVCVCVCVCVCFRVCMVREGGVSLDCSGQMLLWPESQSNLQLHTSPPGRDDCARVCVPVCVCAYAWVCVCVSISALVCLWGVGLVLSAPSVLKHSKTLFQPSHPTHTHTHFSLLLSPSLTCSVKSFGVEQIN